MGKLLRKRQKEGRKHFTDRTIFEAGGDSLNALLLIQHANEAFPGQEKLLLEEADIWLEGNQLGRALELLERIGKPSSQVEKLIKELWQVTKNGR